MTAAEEEEAGGVVVGAAVDRHTLLLVVLMLVLVLVKLLVLLRPEVEATVTPPSPPTPCPGRIPGSSANADVENVGFATVTPRSGGSPLFFMLSVVTAIDINFLKDALYQRFLI